MITCSPDEFARTAASLPTSPTAALTASAVFLVAPAARAVAAESAADNRYMRVLDPFDVALARSQHASLAAALRADVPVITFPGDPEAPDGMFPNNVFAVEHGNLIVGCMRHRVRQREATRDDIRVFFRNVVGCGEVDLSTRAGCVAELTGSLVIDHSHSIGYCGLSERCNRVGAAAMNEAFDLKLMFCFELAEEEYHTNVVLTSLAGTGVILAPDGFADPSVPKAIAAAYGGRALWLDPAQKRAYAGNAITLSSNRVWMSDGARRSLTDAQLALLNSWGFKVDSVDLSEIEKAGGSLRCCVAEIF